MRATVTPGARLVWFAAALLLLAGVASHAQAGEMKLQAFLLWGTDDTKPPADKKYQPANQEIRQKLKHLPLNKTNWFEVNRVEFPVLPGKTNEVVMSDKCQVKVRRLAGSELEIVLIGKGKEVVRQKQALPKGEILLLGGNAPNSNCWMVALKQIE